MADTEDGQAEPRRGKMTTMDSNIKFKDPLLNTADRDSDEGEMESLDLDASGKSELTVSRSSSLIANLSGNDDEDTDTHDLFIVVDDPEKHSGTMDSYVTFRVTVKTTRSEYDNSEYEVRRRYNDFLWLRQKLEYTYPTHLVPPLPEKQSLRRLDRFSPEFLRVRRVALEKFLTRVADHPVLSFDKNFQIFLTAKAWEKVKTVDFSEIIAASDLKVGRCRQLIEIMKEFQAHKKQSTGLLGRVSDSIQNFGASYMMKNRTPEFTIMYEYIQTFGEKLGSIDRITQRVVKEQSEYLDDLMEWGPIYTLWSNSEDQLVSALHSMSKAVDLSCHSWKELIDSTADDFLHPLKEYILYTEAIKYVLRRRDAIQSEYDSTLEELNKRKDEREQLKISDQTYSLGAFLGKDPDEVKQNKQEKLEHQVSELAKRMEELNDKTVCADSDLRADMERWHRSKHKDMKEQFMGMADRQIKHYETCLKAWEDAIREIQAKEPVLETTKIDSIESSSLGGDKESTETERIESDGK